MRQLRYGPCTLGVLLVSCATEPSSSRGTPVSARALAIRSYLGALPVFAARLRDDRLQRTTDGGAFVRGFPTTHDGIDAQLPATARQPLVVRVAGDPSLSVDVSALDPRSVDATVIGNAVILPEAVEGADTVYVSEPGALEELRIVRTVAAAQNLRWRLRPGPSIAALRIRDARVEAVDRAGAVRLSTEPMFAIDAHGARLAVELRLDGDTLVASLIGDYALPVVVDPVWVAATSSSVKRAWHTATLLKDGRVLVVGGTTNASPACASGIFLRCVDLYDPATGIWTAGPMLTETNGRAYHTATLLTDGRVLVAGGNWASGYLNTAEIYDPVTNTWTKTPNLNAGRGDHAAVRLADGKVLVMGGRWPGPPLSSAEIYDPTAGTWSTTGTMTQARTYHNAITLASGKVLVAGGYPGPTTSAELFDPATSTWTTTGAMPGQRGYFPLVQLASGKILAIGGHNGGTPIKTAAVYDPTAGSWSATPNMAISHMYAGAVKLADGRVLATGGWSQEGTPTPVETPTAEIYDPVAGSWTTTTAMLSPRSGHSATFLSSGNTLVVGGLDLVGHVSSAELYGECVKDSDCATAHCVDGVCCDTACTETCSSCAVPSKVGTCTKIASGPPKAPKSCGTYLCASGACTSSCATSAECAAGNYCDTGKCVKTKDLGASCAATDQCASGNCVDGVCCDTACGQQCAACDVVGKVGTCVTVAGTPHGKRPACTPTPSVCGLACDGSDAASCHFALTSVACGSDACAAGVEVHAGKCDGAGKCDDKPKACAPFGCTGALCQTTCATAADCGTGFHCRDSKCIGPEAVGATCTDNSACASGHCTDGFCCDLTCTGQCQACDVSGFEGKCSPITGPPHGARPKCTPSDPVCAGSSYTPAALCDGSGGCRTAAAQACGSYGCDKAGCRSACTAPEHCADGFTCESGKCVPRTIGGATCPDGLTSIAPDGKKTACAPYRCKSDGTCREVCTSSDDCAPGFPCDATSKTCVPAPATADAGGCVVGARGRALGAPALFIFLAGVLRVRRRADARRRARWGAAPGAAGRPP